MSNLAEQLKTELTERAKNSMSCQKYLLDWVMNQFREGKNPVIIHCTETARFNDVSKELQERFEFNGFTCCTSYVNFDYRDGRHYAHVSGYRKKEVDITDLPDAQRYACDGKDESDKTLFLENEGFKVWKHFEYGKGNIIEIIY